MGARILTVDSEIAELRIREYPISDRGFSEDDCLILGRVFDHAMRARILTVTRVGPNGAEAINAELIAERFAAPGQDGTRSSQANR